MTFVPHIPSAEDFAKAVFALQQCVGRVFETSEVVVTAERELAVAKNKFVSDGVEGANEAQRKANLERLLEVEQEALAEAQKELRDAQFEHELNVLELSLLKYQLRSAEVAVHAQGLEVRRA